MSRVLGLVKGFVSFYTDDIFVYSKSVDEYLIHLNSIFTVLESVGLTVSPKKLHLGLNEMSLLGTKINGKGIRPEESKFDFNLTEPQTDHQARSMVGQINYLRPYLPNFAAIMASSYDTFQKKNIKKFMWTPEASESLKRIGKALEKANTMILTPFPDNSEEIVLEFIMGNEEEEDIESASENTYWGAILRDKNGNYLNIESGHASIKRRYVKITVACLTACLNYIICLLDDQLSLTQRLNL